MMNVPTAPIVAVSLVGGYLVATSTRQRPLGGAVLAAGGVLAGRRWMRSVGAARTVVLTAVYLGSFGGSHPLAKRTGAWPAVFSAAGVSAAAAWLISDRRP